MWMCIAAVILNEGETITKVGIIQNGKCSAYAQVPHTTQVQVSHRLWSLKALYVADYS